jgi:hypothetical protein
VRFSTRRRPAPVSRSAFAGFRFPAEVITVAVRWYLRYGLSYRDVEELLAERGVEVDHVTVYRGAVALIDRQRIRAGLFGEAVLSLSNVSAVEVGFRPFQVSA